MIASISNLIQAKELIWAWTGRIVRSRYQQSVLGGLWIIIQPVATVLVFTVIFTLFIPVDTGDIPYIVFSYTALVPWMLFSNSVADMSSSIVDNMSLVTKIYFPREILPISALLARLLDFAVAESLLLVLMLIYHTPLFPTGWLFLPIILAIQLALALGLGLASSAANVFFRDVKPLLTLCLQLWFYATPIIYPVTMVPERLRPLYFLNPMAGVIEAYRAILLYQQLPGSYLYISGIVSLLALISGYWFFKRVEFQFVDIV